MIGIEAWRSALLNKQCPEGLLDENRIILTVSNKNLNLLRHDSLEGSSSSLCLCLPSLQLLLI